MVCDKVDGVEAAEAEEEEAGYRTKNKNPTQRCGEKCSKPPTRFFWIYKDVCDIL